MPGVAVGLVLAVVLFAVNDSRLEQANEVAFGETYHSNVDRSLDEREALRSLGERVQVLRVNGFVFFGTSSGLLELDPETGGGRGVTVPVDPPPACDGHGLLGGDVVRKVAQLAEAHGFELVLTDGPEAVRAAGARRGSLLPRILSAYEGPGSACSGARTVCSRAPPARSSPRTGRARPSQVCRWAWRRTSSACSSPKQATPNRQDDPPDDVFVLESGRLSVEMVTPEGTRMRLRAVRPGVVVGEIAMYTGVPRTADVVAETPSVVLRLSRASIEQLEADEPELAAALHRWLATTLAERLSDTLRAFEARLD